MKVSLSRNKSKVAPSDLVKNSASGSASVGITPLPIAPGSVSSNSRIPTIGKLNPLSSAFENSLNSIFYQRLISIKQMARSEKDMPMAQARDAPSFDGSKGETFLPRFIETVTELLDNNNVTDVQRRKKWLGRYADPDTEEEWKGLATYEAGSSYEDHVKAIKGSYWKTRDMNEGSITKLNNLVRENRGLTLDKQQEIFDFIRKFRATITPLDKLKIMTNRELVLKFFEVLAPSFRNALEVRLEGGVTWKDSIEAQNQKLEWLENQITNANAGQAPVPAPVVGNRKRRLEDLYKVEEVLEEVIEMIERGITGAVVVETEVAKEVEYTRAKTPIRGNSVRVKTEEIESQVEGLTAFMKDMAVNQEKRDKAAREEMRLLSEAVRLQSQQSQQHNQRPQGGFANSQRNFNTGNSFGQNRQYGDSCFYCGEGGHMQSECEHRQKHLREGLIVMDGGSFKLPSGVWFPRLQTGERKTPREHVEEYYSSRKKEANSYGLYDFLGNDREDAGEHSYSTYMANNKG